MFAPSCPSLAVSVRSKKAGPRTQPPSSCFVPGPWHPWIRPLEAPGNQTARDRCPSRPYPSPSFLNPAPPETEAVLGCWGSPRTRPRTETGSTGGFLQPRPSQLGREAWEAVVIVGFDHQRAVAGDPPPRQSLPCRPLIALQGPRSLLPACKPATRNKCCGCVTLGYGKYANSSLLCHAAPPTTTTPTTPRLAPLTAKSIPVVRNSPVSLSLSLWAAGHSGTTVNSRSSPCNP